MRMISIVLGHDLFQPARQMLGHRGDGNADAQDALDSFSVASASLPQLTRSLNSVTFRNVFDRSDASFPVSEAIRPQSPAGEDEKVQLCSVDLRPAMCRLQAP